MTPKVSSQYLGARGQEYFRNRQEDPLHLGYFLNSLHFAPYLKPEDRILDFGCANGGLLRQLKPHVAVAHGLEVNAASRALAVAAGGTIYASLDEIPANAFYDAIVTNHVLEHIRDVCATLEVLRAHLRPGGLLIAALPIDDFSTRYQRTWANDDRDHHLATWTPRLFANVLIESGYTVKECRVLTSAWHPKLFPFYRKPFQRIGTYLTSVALHRRQLIAVGAAPDE
jgi:SAM-dependent methyltransferase